jgi:hypothetical protein
VRGAVIAAVALSCMTAGGCASYQGSTLSLQLVSWNTATGFWSQIDTVLADAARVGVVEGRGVAADVRTDCVVLSNDTRGAHQLLPAPDRTLTAGLDQALRLEQSAAGDCYDAAPGGAAALARADGERARAGVALGAARALYQRLIGTAPGGGTAGAGTTSGGAR